MTKLKEVFTDDVIQALKEDKTLITTELLESIRSFGNEGKHLALEILDTEKDQEGFYLDSFGNRLAFLGNRGLKGQFSKMNLFPIHKEEIERCKKDIHYFKDNYIQIRTKNGVNFPEVRDYQNEFIDVVTESEADDIVGLMGRQCAGEDTVLDIRNGKKVQQMSFKDLFEEIKNENI